MSLWKKGVFAFTDAFYPPKGDCGAERSTEETARARYRRVIERLRPLWVFKGALVDTASRTHSWQFVTEDLMLLRAFGGLGFSAKEVMLDLVRGPLFMEWTGSKWVDKCIDRDTWCPIGPGARRGLNRMFKRFVQHRIHDESSEATSFFINEARQVLIEAQKLCSRNEGSRNLEIDVSTFNRYI